MHMYNVFISNNHHSVRGRWPLLIFLLSSEIHLADLMLLDLLNIHFGWWIRWIFTLAGGKSRWMCLLWLHLPGWFCHRISLDAPRCRIYIFENFVRNISEFFSVFLFVKTFPSKLSPVISRGELSGWTARHDRSKPGELANCSASVYRNLVFALSQSEIKLRFAFKWHF